MIVHRGEEGGVVVRGRVELTVAGNTRVLGPAKPITSRASCRTDSGMLGARRVRSSAPALLPAFEVALCGATRYTYGCRKNFVARAGSQPRHPHQGVHQRQLHRFAPPAQTFDSINPGTGKLLARVASGDTEDINRAVTAARAAFRKGVWSNLAPNKRQKILKRFAELIRQQRRRAGAARNARHGQAHCGQL